MREGEGEGKGEGEGEILGVWYAGGKGVGAGVVGYWFVVEIGETGGAREVLEGTKGVDAAKKGVVGPKKGRLIKRKIRFYLPRSPSLFLLPPLFLFFVSVPTAKGVTGGSLKVILRFLEDLEGKKGVDCVSLMLKVCCAEGGVREGFFCESGIRKEVWVVSFGFCGFPVFREDLERVVWVSLMSKVWCADPGVREGFLCESGTIKEVRVGSLFTVG